MIRIAFAAAILAAVASPALAQSTTRSTTTTTVTEEGDTTVTRSETTTTTVGVDGEALVGALVGALAGEGGTRGRDWLPSGERFRPEDVFGAWEVRDRRGFAPQGCRLEMSERGFLGARGASAGDCRGAVQAQAWRIMGEDLVVFRNHADELDRLRFVDGVFVGRDYMLTRPGEPAPGWIEAWADGRWGDRDDRRGGGFGGWGGRLDMAAAAGEWRMIEAQGASRRECRVTLTEQDRFDGQAVNTSGCFGQLMHASTWRIEDGRVAIYRVGGAHMVTLAGSGRRLAGRTEDGTEIVLYR